MRNNLIDYMATVTLLLAGVTALRTLPIYATASDVLASSARKYDNLESLLDTSSSTCNCNQNQISTPSFCGIDDVCRPYSCENWYLFGPKAFTAYDKSSSSPLSCRELSNETLNNAPKESDRSLLLSSPPGVTFNCDRGSEKTQENESVVKHFDRVCESEPSPMHTRFTCYEFGLETDFSSFVDEVESTGCGVPNENVAPRYSYNVTLESHERGVLKSSSIHPFSPKNTKASHDFEPSLARGLIHARLDLGLSAFAEESPKCKTNCTEEKGEFCGTDGECHLYSCEHWYKYGNTYYTGYTDKSGNLTCHDISDGGKWVEEKSVGKEGKGNLKYMSKKLKKEYILKYDRSCHAKPMDGGDFECREMHPKDWTAILKGTPKKDADGKYEYYANFFRHGTTEKDDLKKFAVLSEGDSTLAARVLSSAVYFPCDKAKCTAKEGGYFCGNDNRCHAFNCNDWYEHGPTNLTAYKKDKSEPLQCESISKENTKSEKRMLMSLWPWSSKASDKVPQAIRFGCPSEKAKYLHFGRKCNATAGPEKKDTFTCYDMEGVTIEPFKIEEGKSMACENSKEKFGYAYRMKFEATDDKGKLIFRNDTQMTTEHNKNMAEHAIYSKKSLAVHSKRIGGFIVAVLAGTCVLLLS